MKKIFLSATICTLLCCALSSNATAAPVMSGSSVTVAASTDWDKTLDEYEQYVNQYVKTYKKAMDGDMSAMTEYAKLMKKAQSLSDKLSKAKGEMSNAQLQRYLKITQKMTNAIQ